MAIDAWDLRGFSSRPIQLNRLHAACGLQLALENAYMRPAAL